MDRPRLPHEVSVTEAVKLGLIAEPEPNEPAPRTASKMAPKPADKLGRRPKDK